MSGKPFNSRLVFDHFLDSELLPAILRLRAKYSGLISAIAGSNCQVNTKGAIYFLHIRGG
jgi:hypothetical protein